MATEQELRLRAKARRRRAEAKATSSREERGPFDRFARGFGDVLADTAGLPVGAAKELGNLTGLTDFENTSGSDQMRSWMSSQGLSNAPGKETQGVAGAAGSALAMGGTLGAGLMGAAGRLAAPAAESGVAGISAISRGELPSTARRVMETIGRPAVSRPSTVGGAELGAAAGAGAASEAASEEWGPGSWQQAVAELSGGIAGGSGTATAGTGAIKLVKGGSSLIGNSLAGQATAAVSRLFGYQRAGAGRPRASSRTGDVAANPTNARNRLVNDDEVDADVLSVPQRTGDPGIMRLGAATRTGDTDSTRLDQWREGAEKATNSILQRIDESLGNKDADPDAAVSALRGVKQQSLQAMDDMLTAAGGKAARDIEKLGPEVTPERAAQVVRKEVESALGQFREIEGKAWDAIPDPQREITATRLDDQFQQFSEEAGDDVMQTLPGSVRRFLGNVEEPEAPTPFVDSRGNLLPQETPGVPTRTASFEELKVMRSELLRNARQFRRGASPDYNKARIHESLADAITDDFMDTVDGLPPASREAFNFAREVSAKKNQLFRQGAVGNILRTGPDGGPSVAPEMTLNSVLGQGARELRTVGTRQLEAVLEDNPAAWGAVDDYLRHQFNTKAIKNGEVNEAAANKFLEDNAGVLGARPELQDQLNQAIESGRALISARNSSSELAKELNDPLVNKAEVFLRAAGEDSVDEAAKRVLQSANSRQVVRKLKSDLAKDKSGEGLRGLRKAVTDEIIGGATLKGDGQSAPQTYLDGGRLRQIFAGADASPDGVPADILRARRAVNELYSPEELSRLRKLANTAYRVQQDIGAQKRPTSVVMSDASGRLLQFSSQALGASAGSRVARTIGTGNIQTPGAGANLLEGMVRRGVSDPGRRLIVDAIDGKTVPGRGDRAPAPLMDVLLRGYTREPLAPAQERSIAAYLEALGPEQEEETEPVRINIRKGNRQ